MHKGRKKASYRYPHSSTLFIHRLTSFNPRITRHKSLLLLTHSTAYHHLPTTTTPPDGPIDIPSVLKEILRREAFGVHELKKVLGYIKQVVDMDESKRLKRIIPRRGLDADLDNRRDFYEGMESFLDDTARRVVASWDSRACLMRNESFELSVRFMPQIGYIIEMCDMSDAAIARFEAGEFHPSLMAANFTFQYVGCRRVSVIMRVLID